MTGIIQQQTFFILRPGAAPPGGGITIGQVSAAGSKGGGTGAFTFNFGTAPAIGSRIVVCATVECNNPTVGISAVADNQIGNSYSQVVRGGPSASSGYRGHAAIWLSGILVASTGTFTMSVTGDGSDNYAHAMAFEVLGLHAVTPNRVSADNEETGTSTSESISTATGPLAGDLVVACISTIGADTNTNLTDPSSGYTRLNLQTNSTAISGHGSGYKLATGAGAQSADWTCDSQTIASVIAVFAPA